METDFTLSTENPLWPILVIVISLVGMWLQNRNSANPVGKKVSLDFLLSLMLNTKLPLVAGFAAFILSNASVKAQLVSIWEMFMGGTSGNDTQPPGNGGS
jgi:hypothetical protein